VVERSAVNRLVVGSNPTSGAIRSRERACFSLRLVPAGPADRSQAVYCLETDPTDPVPEGRYDSAVVRILCLRYRNSSALPNRTVPTGRISFFLSPGSELPGYDHSVPPGTKTFDSVEALG
jgi:hypothetical protein